MFLINAFTASPLRAAIVIISTLIGAIVIFGLVTAVLAYSGGPGQCTPGGGIIIVNDANADSFDQKWDAMDAVLDSGSPSSITLNESEISSRADRYFTEEASLDLKDVRVCIHDGYGEATGKLDYGVLGLDVEIKLKGTVALTGGAPKTEIDDIDFGNIPGWLIDVYDAFLPTDGAINEALENITLKHTYTPTLMEGQVRIDGTP